MSSVALSAPSGMMLLMSLVMPKGTLIYDTEECKSPMHGMIVDYGDGNYDVKLVRVG